MRAAVLTVFDAYMTMEVKPPGYHLLFTLLVLAVSLEDAWSATLRNFLAYTLFDDLAYLWAAIPLGYSVDPYTWYRYQLGLLGWEKWWDADFFVKIPVYSWLMGLTVYARLTALLALWLREKRLQNFVDNAFRAYTFPR
ncbi:hypothetical protein [Thermofilum pendens]|uniref:hypothetical protein n=1 Tax=Thermofilum pendens TaxID=2269 RepID=UPI000B2574B2|nr:hypothetical protein [Thermofilum pendens]